MSEGLEAGRRGRSPGFLRVEAREAAFTRGQREPLQGRARPWGQTGPRLRPGGPHVVPVVLWALGLRKPRAAGEQPESSCHCPVPSPALLGSAADLELLFPCPQQKDPETRLLLKTAALQWAPLLGPGVPARPVTLPGDSVPDSAALRLTGTPSPSTRPTNVPAGHRGWGTAQQEMRPPRPPPSGRSRSGGGDGPRGTGREGRGPGRGTGREKGLR